MNQSISHVSLLVHDYDEAIRFFVDALQFELKEDTVLGGGKRWVVVAPRQSQGGQGAGLLLAQAIGGEQMARIGDQTGGRVFLFLQTDDFEADHAHMQAHGVHFEETPRQEVYGTVAVFRDLCGNKWDLLQRKIAP